MPVGSHLVELLSDGAPRSCGARYKSSPTVKSLRYTNLSRSPFLDDRIIEKQKQRSGRRHLSPAFSMAPCCTRNDVIGLSRRYQSKSPLRARQRASLFHSKEQLGMDMTGKVDAPPSPRHKIYVSPPKTKVATEPILSNSRTRSQQNRKHLVISSLVPLLPSPKKKQPEEEIVRPRKRRSSIRLFHDIPGENTTPRPQRVKFVRSCSEAYEPLNLFCDRSESVPTKRPQAAQVNKSHFSLAHSTSRVQPVKRIPRANNPYVRSASVDIISWRNAKAADDRNAPLARQTSVPRALTPRPRDYNIITNSLLKVQ